MDDGYGCAEVRPLIPELATGAVTGQERAAALRHVAGCLTCRTELAELAKAVDSLLLLAPEAEPPAGFENAVIARLGNDAAPATHRRIWTARPRRALAGAIAGLVATAMLGAGTVWWRTAEDRTLAAQTRQTLAVANGKYLRAARLTSTSGATAGTVFLYQGNPSWLLVSVTAAPADGPYDVRVVGRNGGAYPIGACHVASGVATAGYQLSAPVASIAVIELNGSDGALLTART